MVQLSASASPEKNVRIQWNPYVAATARVMITSVCLKQTRVEVT